MRLLRPRRHRVDHPILVYQMGKVGSMAVYEGLRSLGLGVPIHHVHLLNNLAEIECSVRETHRGEIGPTLESIETSRRLRERFVANQSGRLNVVTMVRDPVQRNLSAFVQVLPELVPGVEERVKHGSLALDELLECFASDFDHAAPLEWFDTQVRDVFGLDVFERAFDHDAGYVIYDEPGLRLLALRLEDLDWCLSPAIEAFLGVPGFAVGRTNATQDTAMSAVYRSLLSAGLPEGYLDTMYGSQLARHFYRPEEIEAFRRRWTTDS